MGFLDNSTNNIIVDAVLTDAGRDLLSKGDFEIVKFAFGDDEVDYTLIKKFGRTVGKQKIELNTPIFEAHTNGNLGLKHRLMTFNDPLLFKLPSLVLTTNDAAATTMTRGDFITLNFEQRVQGENVAAQTVDSSFLVSVDSKFLFISDGANELSGARAGKTGDGFQMYRIGRTGLTGNLGSTLSIKVQSQAISQASFTFYGDTSNKQQITTLLSVVGVQSGARVDIPIVVTQT